MRKLANLGKASIQISVTRECDTVILGAGSMGLATAFALVKRGHRVVLLDRFDPPHTYGSHHGETRLFRMVYAEGSAYVPLLRDARRLWAELEDSVSPKGRLFAQTGVLNAAPAQATLWERIRDSLNRYQLPHEWLNAAEVTDRWPDLHVPRDYLVLFDSLGGILFCEQCLLAYREHVLNSGADLLVGDAISGLEVLPHGVRVQWGPHTIAAANLVITLGAGTPRFLAAWFPEWRIPLRPVRKTVAWFNATMRPDKRQSSATPGYFIETTSGMYYGFPDFGEGFKVGRHDGGETCDPDTVNRDFSTIPEDAQVLTTFAYRYLPRAHGLQRGNVCLYTLTPDEHFVIDHHPEYSHVVIGAGFSGHGFKFASVMGDILCRMITGETLPYDMRFFSTSRWENSGTGK